MKPGLTILNLASTLVLAACSGGDGSVSPAGESPANSTPAAVDEVNQTLFAFASYHAVPNRIRRLRAKAAEQGHDPNVWFRNAEVVVSNEVGRQPVEYVRNIFKYNTAYSLLSEQNRAKQQVISAAHARS